MELNEAINTLAVRLYEWSVRDFLREMSSDCPLLSTIGHNQRRIGAFISWNKTLTAADRWQLATAIPLMFHNNARNIMEKPITENIQQWAEEFYEQTTAHLENIPPLLSADRGSSSFHPASSDSIFATLRFNVSPCLGEIELHRDALSCKRKINDWNVITEFSYARRESNLMFEYQFVRTDGAAVLEPGYGPFPRNLCAFYGIWPHTVVAVPSREDCEPMAKAMANLAEHFVSQADPLFTGLGLKD
jgi:hypothetical protein